MQKRQPPSKWIASFTKIGHILPWCAWPTGAIINMDVLSTIFYLCAQPSDMLHTHYVITIHLNQLAVTVGHKFRSYQTDETTNSHRETFPNVVRTAHQLIASVSPDGLLRHLLHVIPTTSAISRRKIQSLVKKKSQTKVPCLLYSPRMWSIKSDARQLCPAWVLKFSGLWTAGKRKLVQNKRPCSFNERTMFWSNALLT